jgi:hypothetical protein
MRTKDDQIEQLQKSLLAACADAIKAEDELAELKALVQGWVNSPTAEVTQLAPRPTDRELLELAAKAAGIIGQQDDDGSVWLVRLEQWWNPLTDDGDAFRLAMKLGIKVWCREDYEIDTRWACASVGGTFVRKAVEHDIQEAARYVVTKAAANIGRGMK